MTKPDPFVLQTDIGPVTLDHPETASTLPSIFAFGLPKAGSTMFMRLLHAMCVEAGVPIVEPFPLLYRKGIAMETVGPALRPFFRPRGYAYIGFRNVVRPTLPNFAFERGAVLVRDPRDMLVSLFFSVAFSHRAPPDDAAPEAREFFSQQRASALSTKIDLWVHQNLRPTRQNFARLRHALDTTPLRVWRYEDVIFEKERWAQELSDHYGLGLTAAQIAKCARSLEPPPDVENPQAHVRKATPGDHLDKLRPATIAALNRLFAEDLARFGYDRETVP